MSRDIPERDWKIVRKLHVPALERLCERILSEITRLANDITTSAHERYLLVYQHVHDRDSDLASALNGLRRSTAIQQFALMRRLDLLAAEEFGRFSSDTEDGQFFD